MLEMDVIGSEGIGIPGLGDELAEYGAYETEAARSHFLKRIIEAFQAESAAWVVAVRMPDPTGTDPMKGWRPQVVRRFHEGALASDLVDEKIQRIEQGKPDIISLRRLERVGEFRIERLVDVATWDWFASDFYKRFYLDRGLQDAMWCATPLNEDMEAWVVLLRGKDVPMFSPEEAEAFRWTMSGLNWFHRHQVLGEGILLASYSLTDGERQVLSGLLQGKTEKRLAHELCKSTHTIHDRVKTIYRKYGVTSRAELMALWIGKGLQAPQAPEAGEDDWDSAGYRPERPCELQVHRG